MFLSCELWRRRGPGASPCPAAWCADITSEMKNHKKGRPMSSGLFACVRPKLAVCNPGSLLEFVADKQAQYRIFRVGCETNRATDAEADVVFKFTLKVKTDVLFGLITIKCQAE